MHKYLLPVCVILGFMSCKLIKPDASKVKHEFGHTSNNRALIELNCTDSIPEVITELGLVDSYQVVVGYMRVLFDYIALRNQQTFYGNLDKGKFCFKMATTGSNVFPLDRSDARATTPQSDAGRGTIEFTPQIFLAAETDAELAATMSHEAAHITMNQMEPIAHSFYFDFRKQKGDTAYKEFN